MNGKLKNSKFITSYAKLTFEELIVNAFHLQTEIELSSANRTDHSILAPTVDAFLMEGMIARSCPDFHIAFELY